MEYYNRLCDNNAVNSRHHVPSTTCGASSLPSDTILSMQTKSFQPENTTVNGNYCTQSDKRFGVDVETTQHSHNIHKNNNEKHCRNVTGQETAYLPSTSKAAALESAPRERKRWVRPPLVGQASTSDNSTMIQDIPLEAVTNVGTEDDSHHSVQDELLQPNYTENKTDYSVAISLNMNEAGLREALCISPEVNDLKPYSSSQGKGSKMKACRDVKVLSEVWEDVECDKVSENRENFISCRSSMIVSIPLHIRDQTYSPSGQNQDSSVIVTETVGSGRAPSPASVSSVTSSRRLEWDSGADVGYQNFQPGEFPSCEGLSSIERIALARGCSAAQRLEPEGTAGSMQQLNTMQLKPVAKSSKYISSVPMAVSTPVAFGQIVASSVIGTDSESEITPIVKLQAERCIFHGEECSHHHSANRHTTSFVHHQVQSAECKEEEEEGGCNILSKKISTSLTDLSECGLHEAHKYLLPRSRSYLSLLSKEDYRTKSYQYSNNDSFPLRHQCKRNNGLATCSVSSSSIATVVPNHDSPRISGKLIQTSAFHAPIRNFVDIQVSETGKNCKSLGSTSHFPCKLDDRAVRHVATLNLEQDTELEDTNSDIVEKTDSNVVEDVRNAKHVHSSQLSSAVKQNYTHASQIQPQNNSFQKINHHKLQRNRTITSQSSALCKGAHKRGSNGHQWCLSAARTQQTDSERHDKMSEDTSVQRPGGRLNTDSSRPVVQSYVNQSEEEATEKNSGTLDSITSSTRTAGSWFIGDTPQSTNGNLNENESGRRGSSGVVGSANSFEYLPGHVYENSILAIDVNLYRNAITEDSSSESASSHLLANFVDSKFKINDDQFWGSSISSTFATDLDKGIAVLKDLLNSKSYNSDIKKKLVRQVVNRLIETNYAEDNALLESNVPWVPPKSLVNSAGFVSGYIVKKVSQEDVSDGHKVGRTMEREEVSGESASEHQGSRKPSVNHQPAASSAAHQAYFIADKCAKMVLSETSGLSSRSERVPLSENHADSRAETTTSTTQGCVGSSSTSTTFTRNGYPWKELTTQSEKEYEQRKHKPGQYSDKSVLLNLCETERENQLSWIRTEIHHLNSLKQLLEKQRSLRNDLQSFGMQNRKESQKKRRNLVASQKNSEVTTEPESLRSDVTHSSSTTEIHVKKSHRLKHIDKISKLSNSNSPKKHRRTDKFASEIHQNFSDPNIKTSFSSRRDIFTQFPASVELCDKKNRNYTNDKLKLKEKAVQAPTSSDISTNGDTYELIGGMLSDSTVAGRINAFMQIRERNSVAEKDSQGSEVTDANKYTSKASESNGCDETAVKQSKSNDTPLCCCDLKKLLAEISKEIKFKKQRSVDKKSVEGHAKTSGFVAKQKYVSSSGRTTQSKNMDDNSGRSCTLSSSRTLGDVIELTCDSDHVRASVATETVTNIGVQTTQSVSSLPLIRPRWYSLIAQGTEKVSSKAEKDIGTSCKECPCCGALEDWNDTISESSQETASEWKCSRCLKLEQDKRCDRKCQICGILESHLQNSQQDGIQNHDIISWKCSDCLARKLDNAKPVFDKCMLCGLQKDCKNRKEKQADFGSTSNIASTTSKSPIGYILTLETSTDPVSSLAERSEKKVLEEVKIQVPERKRHSVSAKGKRRKEYEKAVSKSNIKSCKENQKPVGSMKDRSPPEDELQRKNCRKEPTLQEYLMAKRPDFIQNAEYRRQCLHELAHLRELRQKSKQRLLALASHISHFGGDSTALVNTGPLPPPPMAIKRIFNQRTMRAQTERKYRNLPEVLGKKAEKKKKEDFRTNRLMAEVFARKLQKRVLKGDVNLSNSRSVISVI